MTDLGRTIDQLTPEKRALLEQRLLQGRSRPATSTIQPRDRSKPAPLSFSQQRLWFLEQWAPGAPTYNAALPMRISGPLDVDALRDAINGVIERHEAVRTVFALRGDEPVQVVLDEWDFELPVVDVRGVDAAERDRATAELLRKHARRPFDLERDVMLRAVLVRVAENEHVLLFQEHHIAFDGWSDGIMFRELRELYEARRDKREPQLPELPIQYGDFAVWQRRRMEGRLLDEHVEYWRRQLAGAPSILRLPADHPRPPVQTFAGAHQRFSLPRNLADGVRELSKTTGTTPFMALLAVFTTLLYRITGQDDVVVGTPIANRGRVELEGLIGFFSNTLVLRNRLGGNPSFREYLARVREVALGAYAHQDLPFEKIVEAVRPLRDAAVNPLFQVNFRVQSVPPTTLELPGVDITPFDVDVGFSRFDLALELQLTEGGIAGYLEYNTELFEATTAERWLRDFEHILRHVLARPDTPLLSLELPSEGTVARTERGQTTRGIRRFRARAAEAAPRRSADDH